MATQTRKTRRRGTPARRTPSTRRTPSKPAAQTTSARTAMAPAAHVLAVDAVDLGEFGWLGDITLTAAEEAVLSEGVPLAEIRIKPTPHPTPYVSHPAYTRWFNRAFGRTGWQLVPAGLPKLAERSVVQAYRLHIHGRPVAFAWGEQEYHETNKDQTYGDALESTHASALRRCAKHLGVGLEMWDRDFLDRWVHEHAVCVSVRRKDGSTGRAWRRRIDPPLPFEGQGGEGPPRRSAPSDGLARGSQAALPPVSVHNQSGDVITDKQRQRLFMIIKNSGRDEQEVRQWLADTYRWTSTKAVTRDHYEAVCRAIEAPGDLPHGRQS